MALFKRKASAAKTTKRQTKPRKISSAEVSRIKNILGIKQLQAMPANAALAFQTAIDPKSTAADFVKVIESDEALSARIIRVANSVFFSRGVKAADIDNAVANIGLDELRSLLSATMLRSLVRGRGAARKQVWANAVATASFCKSLSQFMPNTSQGEAFLCGLTHDVGKLVMIRRGGEYYDRVLNEVSFGEKSFVEAEEEVFELNHVEVGRWVAERWNFPTPMIEAISEHHQPWSPTQKHLREAKNLGLLIKVGNVLAHSAGIGHPPSFRPFQRRFTEMLPKCFELTGMSTEAGQTFIQKNTREFEENFGIFEIE